MLEPKNIQLNFDFLKSKLPRKNFYRGISQEKFSIPIVEPQKMEEANPYPNLLCRPLQPTTSNLINKCFKQFLDPIKAKLCLTAKNVPSYDKQLIRDILKNCDKDGYFSTKLVQDKSKWGRLKTFRGKNGKSPKLSLFRLSRTIRHYLSDDYYYDIDIKNAEPTVLLAYLNSYGISAPKLEHYVLNRDIVLQSIIDDFKLDQNTIESFNHNNQKDFVYSVKDLAKKLPIKIINGGSIDSFLSSINYRPDRITPSINYWKELKTEMTNLVNRIKTLEPYIWSYTIDTCKEKDKTYNLDGTFISYLYFELERRITEIAILANFIENYEIVYELDGFKTPKCVINKDRNKFLSNIKTAIVKQFGPCFSIIEFIVKPMDEKIVLQQPPDNDIFLQNSFSQILKADEADQVCSTIFYDNFNQSFFYNESTGWLWCNSLTNIWEEISSITDKVSIYFTNLSQKYADQLEETHKKNFKKLLGSASFAKRITDNFLKLKFYAKEEQIQLFESKSHLFCFSDGYCLDLDLLKCSVKTFLDTLPNIIRRIQPDDFIIAHCGYPYRPISEIDTGNANRFINSLHENKDNTNALLSFLSCCLYGVNYNQIFPMFTGIGANGKSVLNELIQLTLGNYYQTMNVNQLTSVASDPNGTNSELAQAKYARCITCSEPSVGNKANSLNTAVIKFWTGNEPIKTRALYKNAFSFKPHFTLFLSCNDCPSLDNVDGGVSRRINVLNFPFQFLAENPEDVDDMTKLRDSNLSKKLQVDMNYKYGLLFILLEHFYNNKGKIIQTASIKNDTVQYLNDNNPLYSWANDNISIDLKSKMTPDELYKHYCTSTMKPMKQRPFLSKIQSIIPKDRNSTGHTIYKCSVKPAISDS
jgi:P4 family phage/plasmid primase-like protien